MTHGKNLEPPVEPPSESFFRVHELTLLAQAHGWEGEAGFKVAMQMVAHGTTVEEAREMFRLCTRRIQ